VDEKELRAELRGPAQACKFEKLPEFWTWVEETYGELGMRALCREDRFYLLTQACARIDAYHPWLYARCRELEADPDDHLDLWAREHYKSTLGTFAGVIQEILRNPEITIGVFSHTAPVAKKFMQQVKGELEQNARLKMLFPDILWENPQRDSPLWSIEKGIVVRRATNPKEATVEAHGLVDSQPIGAHFNLMVYDDVVTPASVTTPEMVLKTTEMWELSDNLGARDESGLMRKWHFGTRYSFADTYQSIIDRKILKVRLYPATDNGLIEGTPVFLTPEAWAKKKATQSAPILAAQMLQNPAAGTQAMFNKDWLRFSDVRPSTLVVAIMVDPASSRKKGSDSTVMHVWGMDVARNRYLLDGWHHKMGLKERWTRLRDLHIKWSAAPGVQLVKVGYERYGMQTDIEYFEEMMEAEKRHFPIIELAWPREGPGSKRDRIQRLEPDFKGGKILLSAICEKETRNQATLRERGEEHRIYTPVRRTDEMGRAYSLNQKMLQEYLVYPFAAHDDAMDCASRWDDMDMRVPVLIDERHLEPESFVDGG
jgi:phage terminase large subunit-like protein